MIANEIARVQGAGNQDQVGGAMVRALRQWLETHELPAIIAAVLGVVMTVSVLMVLVGYLVARQ
ncbi:hypothetical protein [Bradyrhizobium sp. URHC0002]